MVSVPNDNNSFLFSNFKKVSNLLFWIKQIIIIEGLHDRSGSSAITDYPILISQIFFTTFHFLNLNFFSQ